ncbi:MAG TPA: hypothetical protein VF759_08715 [Allosphingosinicella sp.]|jgi:hypothetical protein
MSGLAKLPLFFLCLLLSACVTLMAPYDDKFDQMASDLQKSVSTHIEAIDGAGLPDCLYANHKAFYDDARVDASGLAVRAASHELNSETIRQVEALTGSINDFEQLHMLASNASTPRCLGSMELSPIRRAFDQTLGAIMKLEIAKKRGK